MKGEEEGWIMAISLPDARQLSDDLLAPLTPSRLPAGTKASLEADLGDLLGVSREAVCRWYFRPYTTAGSEAACSHERTGRPLGSGRSLCDLQALRIQQLLDDHSPVRHSWASPRPCGSRRRRRRPDSPGVRRRSGGADRGRVPQTLGLHGQEAGPSLPGSRPRRSPPMAGGNLSGYRKAGRGREGADIFWCD